MKLNLILLSSLLAALLAPSGLAEAQRSPQVAFIEATHTRVNRLLERPARGDAAQARRDAQVSEILNDLLDLEELSRRALQSTWDERSPAERQEFVSILTRLVHRSYQGGLERTLGYRITMSGETADGDEVIVETSAQNRENRREPPIRIDYRVMGAPGGFKVVDVVTDGVSMVRNYQRQFRRIIRREGWDGLMQRMRERAAEEAPSD